MAEEVVPFTYVKYRLAFLFILVIIKPRILRYELKLNPSPLNFHSDLDTEPHRISFNVFPKLSTDHSGLG